MSVASILIRKGEKEHWCVIVGLGLVGECVARSISFESGSELKYNVKKVNWSDYENVYRAVVEYLPKRRDLKLDLIWSGGKQGFSATTAEMTTELELFSKVIQKVRDQFFDSLTIRLVSSAGGIYEGTDHVMSQDDTHPIRPYAHYKLKQEQFISDMNIPTAIYRLSTVYGYGSPRSRVGLISALIKNDSGNQPLQIYASESTLRDYVYNIDVAREIRKDVFSGCSGLKLLVSGRSISISSLINTVSRLTGKKPKVVYHFDDSNSADMLFSRSLAPDGFRVTDIHQGILETKARIMANLISCDVSR